MFLILFYQSHPLGLLGQMACSVIQDHCLSQKRWSNDYLAFAIAPELHCKSTSNLLCVLFNGIVIDGHWDWWIVWLEDWWMGSQQGKLFVSLIARFMGPTLGLPGADRTQVGPCWPREPCCLGWCADLKRQCLQFDINEVQPKRSNMCLCIYP